MILKQTLKLSLEEILPFTEEIIKKLDSFKLSEGLLFDIRLSLEEALINAVKHGNKGDKKKNVFTKIDVSGGILSIEIKDEGKGFNYDGIASPVAKENLQKTSGRGIFLIKNFMDKVEFFDRGSKIRMVKYFQGIKPEVAMKVTQDKKDDIVICKIEGEINLNTSPDLRKEFEVFIRGNIQKIIVDFSGVSYIDSSGLATLIELLARLKKIGGKLHICSMSERIKNIFEVTKLHNLFKIYDNQTKALEADF